MILPRLRFAGGRHRCHNSGGSHIAMQGIQKPGFGYQVPLAQKESTLGISRKMMQGCAGRGHRGTQK
jgi:predicted ATP-dependent Lon-type protease